MNAIQITGLSRDYGKRRVVDRLSLTVAQGELFALLGVNGAGKSTTIKMLCCLTAPTEGDAALMGRSVRTDSPGAREVLGSPSSQISRGSRPVRQLSKTQQRSPGRLPS